MFTNLFKYYPFISVELLIYGLDAIAIRLCGRVYISAQFFKSISN